jgi:hypothetical protein
MRGAGQRSSLKQRCSGGNAGFPPAHWSGGGQDGLPPASPVKFFIPQPSRLTGRPQSAIRNSQSAMFLSSTRHC